MSAPKGSPPGWLTGRGAASVQLLLSTSARVGLEVVVQILEGGVEDLDLSSRRWRCSGRGVQAAPRDSSSGTPSLWQDLVDLRGERVSMAALAFWMVCGSCLVGWKPSPRRILMRASMHLSGLRTPRRPVRTVEPSFREMVAGRADGVEESGAECGLELSSRSSSRGLPARQDHFRKTIQKARPH